MKKVKIFRGFWRPIAILSISFLLPAAATAGKKLAGPREMFRALGVGDAYFDRLVDGRPLATEEQETLLRILFRLRTFPAADAERWAFGAEKIEKVSAGPERIRGQIFRVRGRILDVEPCRVPAEAADRYGLATYFRCRLQPDVGPGVVIYAESVPDVWRKGAKPGAMGGALGVFLKIDEKKSPVFAATRLAWHPDTPLGRLGMDYGLFDEVRDRRLIESGPFYAMLDAVGRARPGELLREASARLPDVPREWRWTDQDGRAHYSVAPLFYWPAEQRGRLVALSGTARRVEKVMIEDPAMVARCGVDHYYQVFLFTDDCYSQLNDQWRGNPLTFCVRELPEGMPYGNRPHYGESVRIAGFFLKTWSYRTTGQSDAAEASGAAKARVQLSPLLIGRSLTWQRAPKASSGSATATLILGGVLVAATATLWIVAWRSRRRRRWIDRELGG